MKKFESFKGVAGSYEVLNEDHLKFMQMVDSNDDVQFWDVSSETVEYGGDDGDVYCKLDYEVTTSDDEKQLVKFVDRSWLKDHEKKITLVYIRKLARELGHGVMLYDTQDRKFWRSEFYPTNKRVRKIKDPVSYKSERGITNNAEGIVEFPHQRYADAIYGHDCNGDIKFWVYKPEIELVYCTRGRSRVFTPDFFIVDDSDPTSTEITLMHLFDKTKMQTAEVKNKIEALKYECSCMGQRLIIMEYDPNVEGQAGLELIEVPICVFGKSSAA